MLSFLSLLTFGHCIVAGFALDEMNDALPEMEAAFSESWSFNGSDWPAIAIDKLAVSSKVMRGGQLIDANTVIFIRQAVFESSAVVKGSIVTVRGTDLAVLEIDSDGDASRSLLCGPAGIDMGFR